MSIPPSKPEWNELAPLLSEHNIPARTALKAGIVSVRVAMGATAADLPLGLQQPLCELQQHIHQNMQDHLCLLGVPELFAICRQQGLWTARQLQAHLRFEQIGIRARTVGHRARTVGHVQN